MLPISPQSSSLDVATANADQVDAVTANLGHGSRATHLIPSLLLVSGPFSSGLPLLVPFCLRNSHVLKTFLAKNLAKRRKKTKVKLI